MPVLGVDQFERNLRSTVAKLEKQLDRGIRRAALFLHAESLKITPIDTGNLRGGSRTGKMENEKLTYYVGFTAMYAIYVHERLDLRHAPGTQAKFLEEPMRTQRNDMFQIVASEMKLR